MSLPACKWSAAASFTLLVTGSTLTNFNVALSSALKVASLNCVRAELNDGRQLSLQLITSGSHRNSLHPTPFPLPSGSLPAVPLCSISHSATHFPFNTRQPWPGEHKNYCLQLSPRAHGNVLNSVWKWLFERVYGQVSACVCVCVFGCVCVGRGNDSMRGNIVVIYILFLHFFYRAKCFHTEECVIYKSKDLLS